MDEWSIYIVRCSDNSLYTGISNNVDKRIAKHNSGLGAKYTKPRLPVTKVFELRVGTRSEAMKLEVKVKRLGKSKKEEVVIRGSISDIE